MRIHIGQISNVLAENIGDLETRLDRFGNRKSALILHKKEFGDHYFGFVDMDIDSKQYAALSKALNGMVFRQSKLQVHEARPSFPELMRKLDASKAVPSLNPEQKERARSRPSREVNVFPGRMRESSGIRMEPTFRVKIKGELRKPKMRKRKLWGIEKRPLDRLVSHFTDGEWRDYEDRAVEIVDALHDEHAQAERIAADYAKSAAYLSDSDFEEFKENARDIGMADSDDEIEIVSSNNNHSKLGAGFVDLDSDSGVEDEDEGIDTTRSTVGLPINTANVNFTGNTTEDLRSALNSEAPFTLFGSAMEEDANADADDDADDKNDAVTAAAGGSKSLVTPAVSLEPPKLGLFFPHASPYLRSQTQAAKLVAEFDAKAWEASFFENRGEWNRNLRKRRRDAVRTARRMGKRRGE